MGALERVQAAVLVTSMCSHSTPCQGVTVMSAQQAGCTLKTLTLKFKCRSFPGSAAMVFSQPLPQTAQMHLLQFYMHHSRCLGQHIAMQWPILVGLLRQCSCLLLTQLSLISSSQHAGSLCCHTSNCCLQHCPWSPRLDCCSTRA